MQPTYPLFAVGLGAIVALSPLTSAIAHPYSTSSQLSSPGSTKDDRVESNPLKPSPELDSHPQETDRGTLKDDPVEATDPPKVRTQHNSSNDLADQDEAVQPDPVSPAGLAQHTVAIAQMEIDPSSLAQAEEPTEPRDDELPELEPRSPEDLEEPLEPAGEADFDPSDVVDPTPPDDVNPAEPLPTPDPERTIPEPAVEEGAAEIPIPDYLFPSPNPLRFPTVPEDVEIVGTQPITLEQALEIARRNSPILQEARLELERSQAALRQARAALYPTLGAGSSLTFQENQQQGGQQSQLEELLGVQPQEQDDINSVLGGSLQVNYDLYTAGRRSALIRAAEGQVRFQRLQVEQVLEQLLLDVTGDYYDLQEAEEQVRISRAALEQAEQSLADAQALERAGVGTRFDVLQAQVDLANSRQELVQQLSNRQVAGRQLAQQLNIAERLDVAAADPVEVADLWNLTLEESIILALRNRAELQQQLVQREISQQQRRAALAELGPQVSLFGEYSVQNTLNEEDEGFSDTYQFGLQMNLTLFDGGAARAAANQEESNIAIAENNFESLSNQIRFQVEQAFSELQANFENIQTTALALQQAEEALRLARLRFQAGVGTQTDVLRSQTELTRAQVNRLQAILGYNRSLAVLQRAVSNLPDGTLADTPE